MNIMRRIFTLFIIVLLPVSLLAQSGSGTSGDPYHGTITSSVTWDPDSYTDGEIYVGTASVNDLTIGNGGHLTIWPGATIIFTQPGSDLIITGTGRITADAVPANKITFTKASGNDNRGHISFQSMGSAGASLFDNCIIEYGDVKNLSGASGYGGGIHTDFSDLTVSYCIFRYNTAEWGGGIFVNKGESPTIENCLFLENESDNGGGGIYCWDNTASTIENCIFDSNVAGYGTTSTNYTGAGIALQTNTSIQSDQVINCTFVNNDSNHDGDAIQFYGGGTKVVINSILWGSSNQVKGGTSTRLINCAIQGYTIGTNTINLNASNSASDGPNFNATDGSDWSIKFISPCRDSGTGSGAPASDYDGNGRVYTTDIGAYEVQYSRWTGASGTSWTASGNWEDGITPALGTGDIIIPKVATSYPSVSGTVTVASGDNLILEPGAQMTATGLSNNGNIRFESDDSDIFSFLLGSTGYAGAGTLTIELFLKGGTSPDNMWHYIAAPHDFIDKSVITGIEPYNLLRYDDSKVVTSTFEGWQWHDGYDGTQSWSTFEFTRGYNFYHSTDVTIEYSAQALSRTLGQVNLDNYSDDVDPNSLYGLNLLGNSLSCSIDWDAVSFSNSDSVRNAIYMTKENSIASYVNGVGTNGGTRYIPPLQGFFVRTLNDGEYIDFSSANTHSTQARFKGTTVIPLVRLEAANENGNTDETVIRFNYNATGDFDSQYDASKILSQSLVYPQIYSYTGNEKYSINGISFPEPQTEINLGFKATSDGNYSIMATEIQGIENYDLYLTDIYENNYSVNLKEIPEYTFSSEQGVFDDRFILTVGGMATGINVPSQDNDFSVYTFAGQLNIRNLSDEWNISRVNINIYDITGRLIDHYTNSMPDTGETIHLPFNKPGGIYLIEVTDGAKKVVRKVAHR